MSPEAQALTVGPETWTPADKADAFVASCLLLLGVFTAGYEARGWVERSKPAPQPQIVFRYPLKQWACDPQEFREHEFACAHRERSSAVKPPSKRKVL
jgi:hypothetical protein